MKAVVKELQVGGGVMVGNLREACEEFLNPGNLRAKMNFCIVLPDGSIKSITIRDEDGETVAYGDFEGLPSFLDYSLNM